MPKRKSDAMELPSAHLAGTDLNKDDRKPGLAPVFKKVRVSDASTSSTPDKSASQKTSAPSWSDIELPGEDEDGVPVYDDCGEVRRKIRLLQKTPGWKVTHWLKEIGGINSNSFNRFMKEKGRTDGASNGTYYAAYVYFEKVRILEKKKKTSTRQSNEITHPNGFPLENRRGGWVVVGR